MLRTEIELTRLMQDYVDMLGANHIVTIHEEDSPDPWFFVSDWSRSPYDPRTWRVDVSVIRRIMCG